MVDDYARAGLADRLLDFAGHADLPRRQMSLVRRLLAQMDMHDAGACVEGRLRLARHLFRGDRDMMLFWVGQHAVQRASNDSLVAHGAAFIAWGSKPVAADHASRTIPLLASTRYGRPCRKPALSSTPGSLRLI